MISREGMPELDLEVARALDVARDRDELRAGRALRRRAWRTPRRPCAMIVRHGGQRLDVVDQRRALVEALVGGERRLQARVAALALERVEQRRLLAADVGARAAVHPQRQREVGAEDALAEVAGRLGLLDARRSRTLGLQLVLAADVDERRGSRRRRRRR